MLTSLEIEHACLCLSPPLVGLPPHLTHTPLSDGPSPGVSHNNNSNHNSQVVGLGSGNVKSVEGQLELLLLPSRRLDRNAPLLVDFDRQVDPPPSPTPHTPFSFSPLSLSPPPHTHYTPLYCPLSLCPL